jgi:hypothetical protein
MPIRKTDIFPTVEGIVWEEKERFYWLPLGRYMDFKRRKITIDSLIWVMRSCMELGLLDGSPSKTTIAWAHG